MNILICAGSCIKNANNKIGIALANAFNIKDHNAHLMFLDSTIAEPIEYKDFDTICFRVPEYPKALSIKKMANNNIIKPFYKILTNAKHSGFKKYTDFINDMVQKYKYDYIICISAPFYQTYRVFINVKNVKKIYYQLDPFGLAEYEQKNKMKRIAQELDVIEKSYITFTTLPLYKQYHIDDKYNLFIDKLIPVNFPNLNIDSYQDTVTKSSSYEIYYFGTIDDSYRNPSKIIDFVMSSSLDANLHFYGQNNSESLISLKDKYKDRISINSPISFNEVNILMNKNVFLLNINNSISNQSPSKLIDYISTGNPIVNVIKLPDDESINTLYDYNNHFNFYEYKENDIADFDDFLLNSKNRKLDKAIIAKKYHTYSLDYVSDKFIKVMEEGLNDK